MTSVESYCPRVRHLHPGTVPTLDASPSFPLAVSRLTQEVAQVAEGVNILGVVATALFILIPTSFLITLFIKSESEGNVSGGFDEDYYTVRCSVWVTESLPRTRLDAGIVALLNDSGAEGRSFFAQESFKRGDKKAK